MKPYSGEQEALLNRISLKIDKMHVEQIEMMLSLRTSKAANKHSRLCITQYIALCEETRRKAKPGECCVSHDASFDMSRTDFCLPVTWLQDL